MFYILFSLAYILFLAFSEPTILLAAYLFISFFLNSQTNPHENVLLGRVAIVDTDNPTETPDKKGKTRCRGRINILNESRGQGGRRADVFVRKLYALSETWRSLSKQCTDH